MVEVVQAKIPSAANAGQILIYSPGGWFDINLNGVHFIKLSRAGAALRPIEISDLISWSINKVLQLDSSIVEEIDDCQALLRLIFS